MVVAQAKLTRKHQITIPSEIRRELNLEAGDVVYLAAEDGQVTLRGLSGSWTESYRGLGAELWRQEGGGWQAIEREREAWKPSSSRSGTAPLAAELRHLVPRSQRSQFISEAVQEKLDHLKQDRAVRGAAGIWSSDGRGDPDEDIRHCAVP